VPPEPEKGTIVPLQRGSRRARGIVPLAQEKHTAKNGCPTKDGATNANSRTQASAQPRVAVPREPKKGTMYRAPTKAKMPG